MSATEPSMDRGLPEPDPAAHADTASLAGRAQPLDSTALLQGRKMVEITHNGEVYRLQTTRFGKLILTK